MLKLVIKSFFITMLIISSVVADDTLSNFHQQGDISYPEPISEESYFATKAPMESKSSGYFGANLGLSLLPLKPEIKIGGVNKIQDKSSMIIYGLGVYGGYGMNFQHLYMGSELGAAFNMVSKTIKDVVNTYSTELSVKQPIAAYLDFMPGYINYARDLLFYGRIGIGTGYFKLKFTNVTNNTSNSCEKISLGWRAGLGMEYFMSDTFSLRAEYVYARYNKVSKTYEDNNEYKLNSSGAHQINLGVSVHF